MNRPTPRRRAPRPARRLARAAILGASLAACAAAPPPAPRAAEACAGVSPQAWDTSPFAHPEDVVRVRVLRSIGQIPGRGLRMGLPLGAVVTLRAADGITAESLQRVIDCHLARNAARGWITPEMPDCPLALRGVRARVRRTDEGLAVTMRSRSARVAREIAVRARRLRAPTPSDASGGGP